MPTRNNREHVVEHKRSHSDCSPEGESLQRIDVIDKLVSKKRTLKVGPSFSSKTYFSVEKTRKRENR